MKLLIFGATGPTGRHVVHQSLAQGHEVTAFVRNPDKLAIQHDRLRIVKGSLPNDVAAVNDALRGQDIVLSALGVGRSFNPNDLIWNSLKVIVPAMQNQGPKRLIWLSAFGVGDYLKEAPLFLKLFFRTLLKGIAADKCAGEKVLRGSQLDWTLVYPVVLTNAPKTGHYRVGEHLRLRGIPKISRADVADFMLKQVTDRSFVKKVAVISY